MIPPSLGAFFSQSQSGTFDTPPPAQPTAEENHPTAFLEPTRNNAIFLTPTNSERFYMMREFMLVRYRATKSHFLFRYAYVSHLTFY